MTERVFFDTIAGKSVFCILSTPGQAPGVLLIMSHGFKGTSVGRARAFVDFSRLLTQRGFSVLRFDQPNSGNSEGAFVDSSFDEWVATVTALASKYQGEGFTVALLGHSMGASATLVAAAGPHLAGTIPCVLLWVPDPATEFSGSSEELYEEEGQHYRGRFWAEAKRADFFAALDRFDGAIHLVYGERDGFISPELRRQTIDRVRAKGGSAVILRGEGHSSWAYDACQMVYDQELAVLQSMCAHLAKR